MLRRLLARVTEQAFAPTVIDDHTRIAVEICANEKADTAVGVLMIATSAVNTATRNRRAAVAGPVAVAQEPLSDNINGRLGSGQRWRGASVPPVGEEVN